MRENRNREKPKQGETKIGRYQNREKQKFGEQDRGKPNQRKTKISKTKIEENQYMGGPKQENHQIRVKIIKDKWGLSCAKLR